MELGILERVILLSLLPSESNYNNFKIIIDLKLSLSLSEEEMTKYRVKFEGDTMLWDVSKEELKNIEIGPRAMEIIVKTLKQLDESNKINSKNVSLYEKFMLK